jgi:hypothetical protein
VAAGCTNCFKITVAAGCTNCCKIKSLSDSHFHHSFKSLV